jgi:hypothetical protein
MQTTTETIGRGATPMWWWLLALAGFAVTVWATDHRLRAERQSDLYEDARKTRLRKMYRGGQIVDEAELNEEKL